MKRIHGFALLTRARLVSNEGALDLPLRQRPQGAASIALALIRGREIKRGVIDAIEQIGESNARDRQRAVDDLRIRNTGLFDRATTSVATVPLVVSRCSVNLANASLRASPDGCA